MILENKNIKESITLKINSLVNKKIKNGEKIYNFSIGEPVIKNDPGIIEAVYKKLKNTRVSYPPAAGLVDLISLSDKWFNNDYKGNYGPEETLITCGGKFGLYLTLQAIMDPQDEIIIISPYWVSYPEMIKIFNGTAKILKTKEEEDWKVDISELEKMINNKTKAIILNNASNPTGKLFSREELRDILKLSYEKGLFIISDEVYSGLVYDNEFISSAEFKEFKEKTIIIQSFTKNFAMSGWRVGLVFAPKNIIKILTALQSQSITNTSIVSQWAALEALKSSAKTTEQIKKAMQKRRDIFVNTFNNLFPDKIASPESSLYCFVNMKKLGLSNNNAEADEFALKLIDEAGIALTPGNDFGEKNYLRFSFGIEENDIISGLNALKKYCDNI
jgi:aspartate/methionine/tyrosine aminotransferase